MTNINNFQRDMLWVPDPVTVALPGVSSTWASVQSVRTDGTAYVKHGSVQSGRQVFAGTAGQYFGYGVAMVRPDAGTVPFRVRGYSYTPAYWGFAWKTTVSTTTSLSDLRMIGYGNVIDEAVAVRELSGWVDEKIFFCCVFPADSGDGACALTVQNLVSAPDQYSAKVY